MKQILIFLILLLILGCSSKKPGIAIEEKIWPYEFYQKFNLRTIVSSYSRSLRYYCASYPKDFFTPSQVFMPDVNKVVIFDLNRTLSFELITRDTVVVSDQVNDSYDAQHLYTIYYNEEHDDYRTDTFFIHPNKNCINIVLKKDDKL